MHRCSTFVLNLLRAGALVLSATAAAAAQPIVIPAQSQPVISGISLQSWSAVDPDGAGGQPPNPRLYEATVKTAAIFSGGAQIPIKVRVLLPNDYQTQPTKSYPVLFLLHGGAGSFSDWSKDADDGGKVQSIVDSHATQVIVVMPEGGRASWYSDWYGPTDANFTPKWETFHIKQLVPWVDANLRTTKATRRALAGLSMGGLGALKYAAQNPGVFSAVGTFSGAVDLTYEPAQDTISNSMWAFGATVVNQGLTDTGYRVTYPGSAPEEEETLRMVNLFGPATGHDWPNANPAAMTTKFRGLQFAMYSGRKLSPSDSGEADIAAMNDLLHTRLKSSNVTHRYCSGYGEHSFVYWREDLRDFLQFAYPASSCVGAACSCTRNPGWSLVN